MTPTWRADRPSTEGDDGLKPYNVVLHVDPRRARAHLGIGTILHEKLRFDEAAAQWATAFAVAPVDPWLRNEIAWLLANSPEPALRDPKRAVKLAKAAVRFNEKAGQLRSTLGAALFREGRYEIAVKALEKAVQLQNGPTAWDDFFLAMAHAKLENGAEARKYHERAVGWMAANAPKDPQLVRFRAESEALLAKR